MSWFNSGWKYRKLITLSRASGAVTNYQMKLLLGESSGATGEDVDCGGLCKTDFSDIRFITSDGTTLLDYWIESLSGTTPNQLATIWIEFNSIGTGATTFYMYYGNPNATAVSNGENTFIAFDDFERGSNGDAVGGNWTVGSGSPIISTTQSFGGTRSLKCDSATVYLTYTPSIDTAICFRFYPSNAPNSWFLLHGTATHRVYLIDNTTNDLIAWNGTSNIDTTLNLTATAWQYVEVYAIDFVNHIFTVSVNSAIKTSVAVDTADGHENKITLGCSEALAYLDNVFIRQRLSTEPAWDSWGVQESKPTIYLPFRGRDRFANWGLLR